MIHTPLCDLLGIRYPVLQGGMAWIADGRLAAADIVREVMKEAEPLLLGAARWVR